MSKGKQRFQARALASEPKRDKHIGKPAQQKKQAKPWLHIRGK